MLSSLRRIDRLALVFAAACAACGGTAKPGDAPEIAHLPGGLTVVDNKAPTSWHDSSTWTLTLETTIQPKDGAPGELASPTGVVRTADGRLIVTDMGVPSINLYDADGKFVRTIGRSGDGPGEYRQPMTTLRGDTLVIQDGRLNRVSLIRFDGTEVRTFAIANPSFCCLAPTIDQRARLSVWAYGVGGPRLRRYDLTGALLDTVPLPAPIAPPGWTISSGGGTATYRIPFAPGNSHTLLHDGSILYGSTDRYTLTETTNGHDSTLVFSREGVTPTAIPAALRDSMFHLIVDRNAALRAVANLNDVPNSYPLWAGAYEDSAHNLWVLRYGSAPDAEQFDIFSKDGIYLGPLTAPFAWPARIFFQDGRIAVIDNDAGDLPRVRIFRIGDGTK